MPEYSLPEFDVLLDTLRSTVASALCDIGDFQSALSASNTPQEVVTNYELRKLSRQSTSRDPANNGKKAG